MFYFPLRRFRFWILNSLLTGIRSFVPSFLFHWKRDMIFTLYKFYRISLFVCAVTPYLNQVFRRCFSMDNLRAYAEDDSTSSPGTGKSTKRIPPSSSSLTSPITAPPTQVTSWPVPVVSAPTSSTSTVLQDKTVAVEDLPPPPSPAEPYEQFMARVSRDIASLPVGPPRLCRRGPPSASGADLYDGLPPPYAFSEVQRHFGGFSSTSPSAQNQDAVTGVLLCRTTFSLELARTGPRRTCTAGPYSSASSVHDGISTPSWACSTSSWTSDYGTHTSSSSSIVFPRYEKHLSSPPPPPPPPHFRGFFQGATPPFVPMAPASSENVADLPQMPQDAGNIPQGPTQEMVQSWKAEWFQDMKLYWQQLQGDAPPQSTAGCAVSQGNMGPDALRPLSPSDDREASRAQHKSGSKRAGSDSRNSSNSRERSSVDCFRERDRPPPTSLDSSPSPRHRSPTAKRSRRDRRERSNDSSSSEGRQRSQRHRRPWASRSPGHWRRDQSPSPSPPRRYRSSPAPSRRSSGAGMTKRPAGRPSPSPPRRSSTHRRQSRHPSRDCPSPPPPRSRGPHHRLSSSSSRSPSPKRPRTENTHSRRATRSVSQERGQHPYDKDIHLLRMRADNDDEHYPPSTHPRGSPEPGQSTSVDDADLSAAKVQKLFDDLIPPPELLHYADPIIRFSPEQWAFRDTWSLPKLSIVS